MSNIFYQYKLPRKSKPGFTQCKYILHLYHYPRLLLELSVAQIRLELSNIAKLLLCILGGNRRWDDDILTNLPVDRRSNTLLITRLKRVNDSKHLCAVATRRCGIHHGQANLLLRINDENRANGKSDSLLCSIIEIFLIDHVVEESDVAVVVGDDGEREVGVAELIDVLDPALVGTEVVGAESNHLDAAGLEFILEFCKGAQFGCADGGVVGGVGEEDCPAVALLLIVSTVFLWQQRVGDVQSIGGSQCRLESSWPGSWERWNRDGCEVALGLWRGSGTGRELLCCARLEVRCG